MEGILKALETGRIDCGRRLAGTATRPAETTYRVNGDGVWNGVPLGWVLDVGG